MIINNVKLSNALEEEVREMVKKELGRRWTVEMKITIDISSDELMQMVSDALGISSEKIMEQGREDVRRMSARHLFCFVASEYCGFKHDYIASYMQRSRANITHGINAVKGFVDANDFIIVPALDRILKKLLYEA